MTDYRLAIDKAKELETKQTEEKQKKISAKLIKVIEELNDVYDDILSIDECNFVGDAKYILKQAMDEISSDMSFPETKSK